MGTRHMHLMQIHDHLGGVLGDMKGVNYIGPFHVVEDWYVDIYNTKQLNKLRPIVSLDDWSWDTCGIGRGSDNGMYTYKERLCDDKDNPLYYFQGEILVDEFSCVQNMYYPAITRSEAQHLDKESHDPCFRMEEWSMENDEFWQRWVKQEMLSNIDVDMVQRGLVKRNEPIWGEHIRWSGNDEGANTFAQDLIWYKHRVVNGRRVAGESFHIAYITIHEHRTVRSVVFAVGVFVQADGVYSTMGITKSFRVAMSDTNRAERQIIEADAAMEFTPALLTPEYWIKKYNQIKDMTGLSVQLQRFIASEVKRLGYNPIGLLFRPNIPMHSIMRKAFKNCISGSNIDWDHVRQLQMHETPRVTRADLMNSPSLIIQTPETITLTINTRRVSIPTPFWELKSAFPHPDSALNPHLPLVFYHITDLT